MRRVFQPPRIDTGWGISTAGGLLLCLLIFAILPFTTALSTSRSRQLVLSRVDLAAAPTPQELPDVPPPPPEDKPPEEPPPQLSDQPLAPMNLSVSLDLAVGSGGAMDLGLGQVGGGGTTGSDAFDVSDLERRPEPVSQVPPVYPAELRRSKVEGTVTLVFLLDEEGRVQDPRVESSTRPEFEQPALEALRKWRFRPGMKDGQAVKTFLRLPMRFRVTT